MKTVKLANGKELFISLAPFADARALYQAMLEECKGIKVEMKTEIDMNFFKDIGFTLLASKKVESALFLCMARCTIDKLKVTEDSFEDPDMRSVYLEVCFEVAKANIDPFTKNLYAKFGAIFAEIKTGLV